MESHGYYTRVRWIAGLWENKSNAEAFNANVYPQVLKILSKVIYANPTIRLFVAVALHFDHGAVGQLQSL